MATDSSVFGQASHDSVGEPPIDLDQLNRILEEFQGQRDPVLPLLQRTQDTFGYLPRQALRLISQKMRIPLNQLYGVATFYRDFHLHPQGRHILRVCDGTACHVRGSARNIEAIGKTLGIGPGQTTPDAQFTLEIVYCLGSCGLAPVALLDEKVQGRMSPEALVAKLKAL